ncbi:MAG: ATP synthase F1 subunit gamma [Bacteroidetes bacterium]|nr:ATP synthase F1 subunit gamma [Rhodothermia bacterium]MCS7154409.1 ATP synthase F1 subunit gamma [Bacteroidota bacterium]MCX7907654.1 ATP synthase F1 subunit gamma [Bacteroidota bacterium]MDW8137783.1 ATP synthase F1 subunit gamma [Bacteroidota bacterium]MDW8286366.1 ATP synthase F1 subunit gamma [Bacteroidota bacterium]
MAGGNLRDIRRRIASVRSTQQITRAMKMVAAAKLRRAQERLLATRPYAHRIGQLVADLVARQDLEAHPLLRPRQIQRILLVVFTADRGLCGAFNANLLRLAEETIETRYAAYRREGRLLIMAVGRKGHEFFARRGYRLVGDWRGVFQRLALQQARDILHQILEGYLDGKWDAVELLYNEFKSVVSPNRVVEPLLPISPESLRTPAQAGSRGAVDYLYEPDPQALLAALLPRHLLAQLWRVLLESNAAEQAARMVAMDNATNNATELLRLLRLSYNRLRQASITKELLEIVAGAEALAKARE